MGHTIIESSSWIPYQERECLHQHKHCHRRLRDHQHHRHPHRLNHGLKKRANNVSSEQSAGSRRRRELVVVSTEEEEEEVVVVGHCRVCVDCRTTKTPLWRSGPAGPKSLCNACGIRYRKRRHWVEVFVRQEKSRRFLELERRFEGTEEAEAAVLLVALSCGFLFQQQQQQQQQHHTT